MNELERIADTLEDIAEQLKEFLDIIREELNENYEGEDNEL